MFEARPKAGGLNEYGIAAYKSTDDFAQAEVDYVTAIGGITFSTAGRLDATFLLAELTGCYDAVFIGIGLGGVNALSAEGEEAEGVENAVEFIATLRQASDFGALEVGRRVVVIGGGMTAIDAAVQSKLLGAEEVTICYRRGKEHMNASEFEQDLAATKGVSIRHWLQPKRVVVLSGKVAGIELEYTALRDGRLAGRPDAHDRTPIRSSRRSARPSSASRSTAAARRSRWKTAASRSTPKAARRWRRSGPAATASSAATT